MSTELSRRERVASNIWEGGYTARGFYAISIEVGPTHIQLHKNALREPRQVDAMGNLRWHLHIYWLFIK